MERISGGAPKRSPKADAISSVVRDLYFQPSFAHVACLADDPKTAK
jgi:hypothetical protein